MTPKQRQQSREMRRGQVKRCLATDTTVKEWCSINGVSASTMYCWTARLRKEGPGLFGDPTCGEWIELSRGSLAARTALAVRPGDGDGTRAYGSPGRAATAPGTLAVRVNGAEVTVPEGSTETPVTMALRVLASL